MKTIRVRVGWTEAISLPDANVKPSVMITAQLDDDDDPADVRSVLLDACKREVRAEIDAVLEFHGQAPKYYAGPRYQVLYSRERHAVLVMSDDTNDFPDDFTHPWGGGSVRGLRLEVARRKAAQYAEKTGYSLYDCSDGDLSILPPPPDEPPDEPPETPS